MAVKTYQISAPAVKALADRIDARARGTITRDDIPDIRRDLITAAAVLRLLSRPITSWEIEIDIPNGPSGSSGK
jgi:hypothetical protein